MTPEKWKEIREKLQAVLELEPPQRSSYLEDLAQHDPEVHRQVESLLAFEGRMVSDFLTLPVNSGSTNFLEPARESLIAGSGLTRSLPRSAAEAWEKSIGRSVSTINIVNK